MPTENFALRPKKSKSARELGDVLENLVVAEVAARLPGGAKKTSNSGARHGDGDIESEPYQFCCKRKRTLSGFSVSGREWRTICEAARREGRDPVCVRENKKGEKAVILYFDEFTRLIAGAFAAELKRRQYDDVFHRGPASDQSPSF